MQEFFLASEKLLFFIYSNWNPLKSFSYCLDLKGGILENYYFYRIRIFTHSVRGFLVYIIHTHLTYSGFSFLFSWDILTLPDTLRGSSPSQSQQKETEVISALNLKQFTLRCESHMSLQNDISFRLLFKV